MENNQDSEMVEQVARAIKRARALPGTNPVARLSDVDRRAARAAIEAMREPTEAMLDAACQADGSRRPNPEALIHWQAMIDTALEGNSHG